jgi:quinol monooxygenase YgiN
MASRRILLNTTLDAGGQLMFVQIVKFRLKSDTSRETFMQLTEKMVAWLKQRNGFVAYELYEGTEYWSDRIVWLDKEHAETGLKDLLNTDLISQIMLHVQDDFDSFMGQQIVAV